MAIAVAVSYTSSFYYFYHSTCSTGFHGLSYNCYYFNYYSYSATCNYYSDGYRYFYDFCSNSNSQQTCMHRMQAMQCKVHVTI